MQLPELESTIRSLFSLWADEKAKQELKKVRYSGISFGKEEYSKMLDAIFNNWWSNGRYTVEAERKLAKTCDRGHALLFNSGSTANLALIMACMYRYFKPGDKILTMACGFPTTLNPIIHCGLMPVFADIDIETLSLPKGVSLDGVKGIFIPHTLGFCSDIDTLIDEARERDIIVLYDACDAYGTIYKGKPVTAYGKAATLSFYAAHHLSCGEGGAIVTNDTELFMIARGIRNWGRYCASTECCTRSKDPESFCPNVKYSKESSVPEDYMANYVFEWMGYNFKMLDLQAAILTAQIDRLQEYTERRRKNYLAIQNAFSKIMMEKSHINLTFFAIADGVSPFSFPLIIHAPKKYLRYHFMAFLQKRGIESRMIFAGNLLKHPAYEKMDFGESNFPNSELIMNNGMMLGCSHVIGPEQLNRIVSAIEDFFQ